MSPLALITAFCTLVGLLCILWRPQYAVVLVMFMFPLEQLLQSYFPFLLYNPKVFNIAVLVVTGLALGPRFSRSEPVARGYRNPVTICIWLLYALVWVSTLYTPSRSRALEMLVEGLPYYALMLVVLPMLISDTESFRRILLGLIVTGAAICVLIYLNPATSFYAGRLTIEFGPFAAENRGNPLVVADLGGVISVVAILYRSVRASALIFVLRVSAVLVGLGLAVASGSRGQVVVAIASAVLLFPVSRGLANARQFLSVAFSLVVVLVLVRFVFKSFIGSENEARWGAESVSSGMTERFDMAVSLLSAWVSNPLAWPLGLGANAYTSLDPEGVYVHNMVVEVLCEEGLVGLTLLGLALWFTFRAGRELLAIKRHEPELRAAAAALCALCVYSFVLSLKQGSFIDSGGVFTCWILLAKIAVTERLALAEEAALEGGEPGDAEDEGDVLGWHGGDDGVRDARPALPSPAVSHT